VSLHIQLSTRSNNIFSSYARKKGALVRREQPDPEFAWYESAELCDMLASEAYVVHASCDVWALGVLSFWLVTGMQFLCNVHLMQSE